jgi:hypothetical protein
MVRAAAVAQLLLGIMEPPQMVVMAAQELLRPFLARLSPMRAAGAVRYAVAREGQAALVVAEMALTMIQPAALEVQTLAAAAAAADIHQRAALAALAGLVSSLFAMQTLTLLQLQQQVRPRSQLLAAIAFTNGLALGASPSDERNNGALC